jgi:hypothetical protein
MPLKPIEQAAVRIDIADPRLRKSGVRAQGPRASALAYAQCLAPRPIRQKANNEGNIDQTMEKTECLNEYP